VQLQRGASAPFDIGKAMDNPVPME
jgi:hypothetical protein